MWKNSESPFRTVQYRKCNCRTINTLQLAELVRASLGTSKSSHVANRLKESGKWNPRNTKSPSRGHEELINSAAHSVVRDPGPCGQPRSLGRLLPCFYTVKSRRVTEQGLLSFLFKDDELFLMSSPHTWMLETSVVRPSTLSKQRQRECSHQSGGSVIRTEACDWSASHKDRRGNIEPKSLARFGAEKWDGKAAWGRQTRPSQSLRSWPPSFSFWHLLGTKFPRNYFKCLQVLP